jgi:hypothetical protein
MQSRSLQQTTSGSTILTVPIEFVRELGIADWIDRTGRTDYRVWVTWLADREAVSYYFPEPETDEYPDSASPRQLQVKQRDDYRCYRLTVPAQITNARGITADIVDNGYSIFPELNIEDRLLTVELPRPDERANPWDDLDEADPESPTADWLLEGTHPDGTDPEPTSANPTQRSD